MDSILTILACREEFQRIYAEEMQPSLEPDSDGATTAVLSPPVVLDGAAVLRFLTFDRRARCSILSMVTQARENARATQEVLSAEAWSQVNRVYLYLSWPKAQKRFQASPFRFFESIKRSCILFGGLVDSTLPRSEVFHFLQLGRYLERVDVMSRILTVNMKLTSPTADGADMPLHSFHWTSLLRSCSAYEAYLREHPDRVDPISVVRYLVLGADFPRAMRFCVARCLESLKEIAGAGADDGYGSEAERLLGRLDGELRYLDPGEIFGSGLYNFLSGVQETCGRVGAELQQAYFLQ